MKGRQLHALTVLQMLAVVVLFGLLVAWNSPWNAERYIGTILVIVAVSFMAVARYQLGKAFSLKAEARELVTHGLYSKIRNPIYVFGVVMVVGLCLVFETPILWFLLPVVIVVQSIRARREARVLEAAFGDAYRQYRRKTWF